MVARSEDSRWSGASVIARRSFGRWTGSSARDRFRLGLRGKREKRGGGVRGIL
jgi:hypothetical protein